MSMNLGRRRSQALTVTILKPRERSVVAAGAQPGPRIAAARPEQIETPEGK
jgi:hypothetical protein